MSQLKPLVSREWQAFWLAIGFLTRIPMLVRIDYSPRLMNQCSVYFPLVGLVLGVIYAGCTWLWCSFGARWSVSFLFWVFTCGLPARSTRWIGRQCRRVGRRVYPRSRLRIMKDSRIGTYGTVALVVAVGAETCAAG